jgi:hypothetical protein
MFWWLQGVNYDPMNPMGKEESFKADMKATTRVTSLVTKWVYMLLRTHF